MPPIDHAPDFTAPSTSVSVLLAIVNPRLADGSRVPADGYSYTSSDEAVLPQGAAQPNGTVKDENGNEVPDPVDGLPLTIFYSLWLTPQTPDPGTFVSATVTGNCAGMVPNDVKISYGDPALGHAAFTPSVVPET